MLLIVAFVLLLLLPTPWNVVGAAVCVILFLPELAFWNRKVKHRRAATGVQTLVGRTATVETTCRPRGQVRIDGELWKAVCDVGADPGTAVRILSVEGLILKVEPIVP
jgi:membrane protein implicated in regulation of membrane protease activity